MIRLRSESSLDAVSVPQCVARADGRIHWIQPVVVTITARHEFRANTWIVPFQFGSWTHDATQLDLRPPDVVLPPSAAADTADRRGPSGNGGGELGGGGAAAAAAPGYVDVDTEQFAAGDHWTLIDHGGQRQVTRHECCVEPFVSLNYVLKLRKKIGPSLLGRRR